MIKIFLFYINKLNYYSSTPIINNINVLFQYKNEFLKKNIEITPFFNYVNNYPKDKIFLEIDKDTLDNNFNEAMNNITKNIKEISNNYEKIIFLAFHPKPFDAVKKKYKELKSFNNIYIYLWQDDLQAYVKSEERLNKLNYTDIILTPSPILFQNLKPKLLEKTKFLFYSIDFDFIKNITEKKRKNKILLSGACNKSYKIRYQIRNNIINNKEFKKIADILKKPAKKPYHYSENVNVPYGIKYYEKLSEYKGAFFGYYDYPVNFNLAKIIEILSMGCIGFFEESPLLEKELNLIPLKHYVPCTKDGKLITKIKYYEFFLNDKIGEEIAQNGKKHIEKYFSNKNQFENYLKILS